jgi:hypothetical protein
MFVIHFLLEAYDIDQYFESFDEVIKSFWMKIDII